MHRPWIAENDAERARLVALVTRLSDAELALPMPAGWTVAAVLAHSAFWDARVIQFLDKWESGGAPASADRGTGETGNIDWINDTAKVLFLAMPPRDAARLAVTIAEAVDRRVAAMSDALVTQVQEIGGIVNLARADHRREHLDEIEAALG